MNSSTRHGERMPAHGSYEQKQEQAKFFRQADEVPWPVLVDDVQGTVAHAYTTLPNAQFVIDADAVVAFRGDIAHGPTLYRALERLLQQGGRGAIAGADDSMPHMLATMTYGWDGIQRGGNVATQDVRTSAPPLAANLWLGNQMQPLLAPLASRGKPLPTSVKVAAGALVLGMLLSRRASRHRARRGHHSRARAQAGQTYTHEEWPS